jgi:hypothetical protein
MMNQLDLYWLKFDNLLCPDMAEQLARVREMERNGELEPIPEISATSQ